MAELGSTLFANQPPPAVALASPAQNLLNGLNLRPTSAAPPAAAASPAAAPASAPPPQGRDQVVAFWSGQGVPDHVAQGIADAVGGESGFNASIPGDFVNGQPTSGGQYQHHDDRLTKLKAFAAAQGKVWTDPAVQNQFALSEVRGGDPIAAAHWKEIQEAPDRPTAKALWSKYFERPATVSIGDMSETAQKVRQGFYDAAGKEDAAARAAMGDIGSLKGDLGDAMKRVRAAIDKSDKAQEAATTALAKPPAQPEIDGVQHFTGLATVVGILGGLLTRSPMRASLNAAASAIEAYNDKDREGYKTAYSNWKTQTDMLFKIADMNATRVKDIMYNEQMGANERRTLLDTTLRAAGLSTLADEARVKGDQVVLDWQEKMQAGQQAFEMRKLQQEALNRYREGVLDKDPRSAEYNRWLQTPEGQGASLDQRAAVLNKLYSATARPSVAAMTLQQFRQEFHEKNGRDPTTQETQDWQATNRERQAEAGKIGAASAGFDLANAKAAALIPLVREASHKIDRTEYPSVNSVILAWEKGTGDPEVVQYGEMINNLRTAYARALSPSGTLTVDGMRRATAVLEDAWSTGQIDAALDQIDKALQVEERAIDDTKRKVTGKSPNSSRSASPAAPAGIPVPADHQSDPDGTRYTGSDNQVYVKRGDKMVPE